MANASAVETHRLKCEMAGEVLRAGGSLRLKVNGWSMLPAIWPGDILEIAAATRDEIAVGDLVLYERDGRFFVHRVISLQAERIVTRGDAMPHADPPVSPASVLGKIERLVRSGKKVNVLSHLTLGQRAIARLVSSGNLAARAVVELWNLRQNLGTSLS